VKKYIISSKEELLNLSSQEFKQFYYFLFDYNLDKKNPKKTVDFEVVEIFYNQLFVNQFKIASKFLEYLAKNKGKEGLKQDQWNCFLEFLLKIGDKFPKGYSLKDAWPTLFDEFYLDYCERNHIELNEEENSEEEN
jgi:hypothetical protein